MEDYTVKFVPQNSSKNHFITIHIMLDGGNKMKSKNNKKHEVKNVISNHIYNNLKEYIIVLIIFFIGLILGIIYINNAKENVQNEINNYILNFINSLKENNTLDSGLLLIKSIKTNLFTAIILWFAGLTIIATPIVYITICFRGFCFGYGVSSIIATLGTKNGIIFCLSAMLFQNIILIPTIFIIAVSGLQLYKAIIKDKRKENVKLEIYRHTILTFVMYLVLVLSSILEVYVSANLVCFSIKYI